ncbi:A1 cistron-splicing factor [Aspergillus karnatakaensis]|uniref:AAR2 splicing factor family protein n=1 Tax=Aspergillus karnatakaensis TaxID=1810916 RepID=UPI003CCDCEB5
MSNPSPTPTLLLPHLPPKTLIGIDLITFTSTPNFHGIRDIPPGWHFLYTGTTEGLSLRCGGWFHVDDHKRSIGGEPEIRVWRWNDNTESLEPLDADRRQEGMRYKANLGALWRGGGLFGYRSRITRALQVAKGGGIEGHGDEIDEEEEEGRRNWRELTDRLTSRLLCRIMGEPEGFDVDWEGRERWVVTSGSTARRDDDDIPGLEGNGHGASSFSYTGSGEVVAANGDAIGDKEKEFSFLPVDLKMTWREGAIGRERTEAARDKSWALGEIIQRVSAGGDPEGEAQVIGELQFTFLMGLTIMNYSCLQQWKRLLRLILTCRRAIVDRASFMADVLQLLLLQLQRCDDVEGGLFDQMGAEEGREGSDFLRKLLKSFRTALYEVLEDFDGPSPVKTAFERLESWVQSEYDWELNRDAVLRKGMVQLEDGEEVELEMLQDEEDDYAPVVVDLPDSNP